MDSLVEEIDRLYGGSPVSRSASTAPPRAAETRPWEAIRGGWERQAVKMWWEGFDKGEIATQLGKVAKTVENRFWQLRRSFGPDIVPLADDPRRKPG